MNGRLSYETSEEVAPTYQHRRSTSCEREEYYWSRFATAKMIGRLAAPLVVETF